MNKILRMRNRAVFFRAPVLDDTWTIGFELNFKRQIKTITEINAHQKLFNISFFLTLQLQINK